MQEHEQEISDFKRDGFCVLRQFFARERIAEIDANVRRYVDNVLPALDPAQSMCADRNLLSLSSGQPVCWAT